MIYNPSMREEPRHRPAAVLPKPQSESILDWLERQGRIAARVVEPSINFEEETTDELNEIIGEDGAYYEDDDDDSSDDDDDAA